MLKLITSSKLVRYTRKCKYPSSYVAVRHRNRTEQPLIIFDIIKFNVQRDAHTLSPIMLLVAYLCSNCRKDNTLLLPVYQPFIYLHCSTPPVGYFPFNRVTQHLTASRTHNIHQAPSRQFVHTNKRPYSIKAIRPFIGGHGTVRSRLHFLSPSPAVR